MKWILRLVLIFVGIMAVAGCSDSEPDRGLPNQKEVRRTVLVYMAANNDLSGYTYLDLGEMIQGSVASDARWIVYLANRENPASLVEFYKGDTVVLKTYAEGSSVTAARMSEVLDDMAAMAPAQSYGLVLWSHGSGWLVNGMEENLPSDPYSVKPLSFGIDGNDKMNISTLRSVVKGRNIDYIYFDACYMSSIEVAYELRDAVDYIVGSASELPAEGMPYHLNMAALSRGSLTDLIRAAENTFNHYNEMIDAASRTCTMAVLKTAVLERVAAATRAIYEQTPLNHTAVFKTNYSVYGLSVNAYDFGEYVNAGASTVEIDQAIVDEFNAALAEAVPYKAATDRLWNTRPIYSTCGLSTYVFDSPKTFETQGYASTQWAQDVAIYHIHD